MKIRILSQKGAVFAWLALSLLILLALSALVLDVGLIYITEHKLSDTADAAALAGASALLIGVDEAEADANAVAVQNGLDSSEVDVIYNTEEPTCITVNTHRKIKFSFAALIGVSEKIITAHAKAIVKNVTGVTGAAPFGVAKPEGDFTYNQVYKLKWGPGESVGGNFGALALGGNGASRYRDNIKYGYDGEIKIDQIIQSQPGNMSGPTQQGVSYRLGECNDGCVYNNFKPGCPKFVICPVVEPEGVLQGRSDMNVVGFAAFFLEGTQNSGSGNKSGFYVMGRFIRWIAKGGYQTDVGGSNFGLSQVRLIE